MASGDTLAIFMPLGSEPPASNYATLDTRNAHPVLDFDPATAESILFSGVLPPNYAGGGLTVRLSWAATTATGGDVVWSAAFERLSGQDIDSDGFASARTATGTANGTSGVLTVTSISFTHGAQIDSLAAGEAFRLQISRAAADAGDTMSGDAELIAVEIREQ